MNKLPLIGVGGLVVAAGAVYGAGYAMAGDHLPRHTTVDGVAIGGMDQQQAEQALRTGLASRTDAPITLKAPANPALKNQKATATLKPADSGLGIDYAATVATAGAGRSWKPSHIWTVLSGGGELTPVVRIDDARLAAAVHKVAPTFAQKPVNAVLSIDGTTPKVTPATQAVALDEKSTVDRVRKAYLSSTTLTAPVTVTQPDATTATANKVLASTLKPTLSGPITVKTPKGNFTIGPKQLTKATSIKPDGHAIEVTTDLAKLYDETEADRTAIGLKGGQDASWHLVDGKPAVKPAVDGVGISKDAFAKAVKPALTATGARRTVSVATSKTPAKFTTAMASKLGVKEVTGEFTTYFPYAEYRNTNLSLAAASINNTFLKPGDTFSLNDTLGPKGPGSGYVDGWVITGDHLTKENAGGVSQSATTTFNAAFFAGLEDVEHHPHTMYFDRYPAGREATVYYGNLDLRFRNNTPYGVLMQAYVDKASPGGKGSITVKVWSTKQYTVKSSALEKSNFTSGTVIHSSGSDCHAQAASPGFTVNYSRLFYKGSTLVKSEPFHWTYSPTDEIVCG